jgi:hypothetical protein
MIPQAQRGRKPSKHKKIYNMLPGDKIECGLYSTKKSRALSSIFANLKKVGRVYVRRKDGTKLIVYRQS